MTHIPTLRIDDLTDDKKGAYVLADNQLAARAGWDNDILAIELQYLTEIAVDFDVTVTGFKPPVIDLIIEGAKRSSAEDAIEPIDRSGPTVSQSRLWIMSSNLLGRQTSQRCRMKLGAVSACRSPLSGRHPLIAGATNERDASVGGQSRNVKVAPIRDFVHRIAPSIRSQHQDRRHRRRGDQSARGGG
jgi:hypothetical protein